jgi:hypothetical protein
MLLWAIKRLFDALILFSNPFSKTLYILLGDFIIKFAEETSKHVRRAPLELKEGNSMDCLIRFFTRITIKMDRVGFGPAP